MRHSASMSFNGPNPFPHHPMFERKETPCFYTLLPEFRSIVNMSTQRAWKGIPYLLLLISMLWHGQAIFESKGDKLSSSAESRIRTHKGLRHQIASRLNAHWQTDWAIEDQAKNLNSTARPYDQRAFSPLDPTAVWHSHLALAIYMFVVVKFDALAQASDIRIERRQVVFLCWEQDSNP